MRRRAARGMDMVLVPPRVEASLWRRWRYEAEARCREQIFVRYRSLAKGIAARQLGRRPRNGIELGDMEQFAYEGLLVAIDRFDPLRGIPFPAFARRRIMGSIYDGAARMSEVDAQYSARLRQHGERARSLIDAGADAPSALDRLGALAAGLAVGLMLADTSLIEAADGGDHRPNAYETLAWRELHALLVDQVARLPEREALIIREHYEHGVSFTHIAGLLGVTKGRVSQIHAKAIARLREAIGRAT